MAKSIKKTNEELAAALTTDSVLSRGLLNYLRDKGLALENGTRPNPSGRGKGSVQYDINWSDVSKHFASIKGD